MKDSFRTIAKSPFFTLLRNIFIVYICFFVCRIAFIFQNWSLYSGFLTPQLLKSMFIGSLKFDTAAIAYLCSLYLILASIPLHLKEKETYYRVLKWLLIICCMAGIIMNLIDAVYYKYSGCRTTIAVFSEFSNENNIGSIFIKESINSWYLVVLAIVLLIFLIWQIRVPRIIKFNNLFFYYTVKTISFLFIGTLAIVGMRGGWTTNRPITLSNANQYVNRPAEAAAVLNTPFCFLRTLGKKPMEIPKYYNEEELEKRFSAVIKPDTTIPFKKKNVVILILEGFSSEYFGSLNKDIPDFRTNTPFLDSLIEESLTFEYSFANGKKSIDALPSILSSIPMMVENFILIPASVSEVSGIAEELDSKGYYSAFFHGAENSSMGFGTYARTIGYKDYFGMTEFENEPKFGGHSQYDGYWGIWDEEFLQFYCDKMNSFKQPFVTTAFTVTSHHPFSIPKRYESVFTDFEKPMQRCIQYSDYSIRKFFESAKKQAWYNNTIFVITADHTNTSGQPEYQNDLANFKVPIIFFDPSGEIKGHRKGIAQQIDILPTILGYLGYDKLIIGFGQNLLRTPENETFAVNYISGIFQYEKGDYLLQFNGENVTGMYNFKEDIYLKNNLKDKLPDIRARYEAELKAIIQQYMEHMHNKPLVIR